MGEGVVSSGPEHKADTAHSLYSPSLAPTTALQLPPPLSLSLGPWWGKPPCCLPVLHILLGQG